LSNVLIGIIGVILFIGLALAGALILGDDFKSSRSASVAAAMISQTDQIAKARQMYTLKLGQPYAGNAAGLVPRFLKTVPTNPSGAGLHLFIFTSADGTVFNGVNQYMVLIGIDAGSGTNGDSQQVRDICLAAAEQSGMNVSAGIPTYATIAAVPTQSGCMKLTQTNGQVLSQYYYIFQKL
jgi:hypothetical protein